jgi:hypothetical protein
MSLERTSLPLPRLLTLVVATAALAACSKTDSAPTSFGVNVTVDATGIAPSLRATITTDKLTVVKAGSSAAPAVHVLADLPKALQGGTVRFHYTPSAGVVAGDTLSFVLDVLAGSDLVASASASVTLAEKAKAITLTLAGPGDGGPGDGSPGDGSSNDGGGKTTGTACALDSECGSGFCTDGVCCNERCNDTCVSCNQAGSKGTCKEYAADTDPELECAAKIPVAPADDADGGPAADAGADADASGDASTDAAGDAGATDAGATDALVINTPDGGFMTTPKSCGGACSGARSCKYPGQTTSCGKGFCNSSGAEAAFVCDGNGGCAAAVTACKDYSCDDATGACRTSCSKAEHCLAEDYCTGAGACTAKKGNSLSCTLASECASGNCSGDPGAKVCCNTACDGQGLTCTEAGHLGQCQCQGVTCAAGVACQVFYADTDHDTYGDATGTIANGRAKAGCAGAPPAGFVADNTDCDDGNSNAHPNQTMYFGVPRANNTYDYDCNGKEDKLVPEYPNGVCRFCGPTSSCSTTTTSCTGTTATGSFQCPLEGIGVILQPIESTSADVASPELTSRLSSILPPPILRQCCGCATNDKSGFTVVGGVKCGAYNYKHTCGTCNGSTANADTQTYTQQTCR